MVDNFLAASPTFEKRRSLPLPFAAPGGPPELLKLSPISRLLGFGWPGILSNMGRPTPEGFDTDSRGVFRYNVTGTDILRLLSFLLIPPPGEGCGGNFEEREFGDGGGVSWLKLVPKKAKFCCLFLVFDNVLGAAIIIEYKKVLWMYHEACNQVGLN